MSKNKNIKILLINFVNSEINSYDFPIGLYTLKSYLYKNYKDKCIVEIKDIQIDKLDDILQFTVSFKPDILGISLMLRSFELCNSFLNNYNTLIKKQDKPLLVFGKNIATFAPEVLLEKYNDAICVIGEGEQALGGLVDYLQGKCNLSSIPNLKYLQNSKIIQTKRELLNDLSLLGDIDYSKAKKYVDMGGTLWVETSRGCPWGHCSFCSTYAYWGFRRWRKKPIHMIVKEFKYISNKLGINKIILTDEEFFGNNYSIRKLASTLIKEKVKINFYINARVNDIYNENDTREKRIERINTILLLKEVGLHTIYLGLESGSLSQLKRYSKGITLKEAEYAIKICEELKFDIHIGWLIFEPLLTLNELKDNLKFIQKNNIIKYLSTPLNQMLIYPSIPYCKLIKNHQIKLNKKLINNKNDLKTLTYKIINYEHLEIKIIVDYINKYRKIEYPLYNCLKWFVRFDTRVLNDEYVYLKETLEDMKIYQINFTYKLSCLSKTELIQTDKPKILYEEAIKQRYWMINKLYERLLANGHHKLLNKINKEINIFLKEASNYNFSYENIHN